MLGRVFIVRINKAMLTLSGVRFEESVTSKDIDNMHIDLSNAFKFKKTRG